MLTRQLCKFDGPAREKRVSTDHQPAGPQILQIGKRFLQFRVGAAIEYVEIHVESVGRGQKVIQLRVSKSGIGWVDQQAQYRSRLEVPRAAIQAA